MSHDVDPITSDVLALLEGGATFTPYALSRRIPGWLDFANMDAIRRHLATIPGVCVVKPANGRFAEQWGSMRHHKPAEAEVEAPKPKASTGDPGRWARCLALQDQIHALLSTAPDGMTIANAARALQSVTPDKADTAMRALHREDRVRRTSGHDAAGRREVRWYAVQPAPKPEPEPLPVAEPRPLIGRPPSWQHGAVVSALRILSTATATEIADHTGIPPKIMRDLAGRMERSRIITRVEVRKAVGPGRDSIVWGLASGPR